MFVQLLVTTLTHHGTLTLLLGVRQKERERKNEKERKLLIIDFAHT